MTTANSESSSDRLLEHAYDGIQEFDNPMPRWWVWIFWATIVFSILYLVDVTGTMKGPGRIKEYEKQMAEAARKWPQGGPVDAAALAALAGNPKVIADGKAVFATNCAPCHAADGGGVIGPNLADAYWLHGGTLPDIYKTIDEGVLAKGMPNWGKMLKPDQVKAVAVYVKSLAGTTPANPKAPQGEKVAP
jgi:cytochrome c oxidase cbb3-type subunit 3